MPKMIDPELKARAVRLVTEHVPCQAGGHSVSGAGGTTGWRSARIR